MFLKKKKCLENMVMRDFKDYKYEGYDRESNT